MIRVLVIGGIRLFREGLAQLLDRHAGIAVVGTEAGGEDVCARLVHLKPDVVLLDMATVDSVAVARSLHSCGAPVRIVALGIPDGENHILACGEAGASGYVTREASIDDLVDVIERAANDELICSPRAAAMLIRHVGTLAARRDMVQEGARLTRREFEICELLQLNLSNKEIAIRLCIEVATVKNHVHNLLDKLQIHRRSEAARIVAARVGRGVLLPHAE